MRQKIEIMRFVQGRLSKKNIELCAKLCAKSNKKQQFFPYFTFISLTFFVKKNKTNKTKVLTYFCIRFNRFHCT